MAAVTYVDVHFFWLRDKHRAPVAVAAFETIPLSTEGNVRLRFSVAARNPKDVFSKKIARSVAFGRLDFASASLWLQSDKPYDHRVAVRKAIIADKTFPQSARDAARLWFEVYPQVNRRKGSNRTAERRVSK